MSMQKNPLKPFEVISKGYKGYRDELAKVHELADRTEATDSYRYLVRFGANEIVKSDTRYPDTSVFADQLKGNAPANDETNLTINLQAKYIIEMAEALKALSGDRNAVLSITINKAFLKSPVAFRVVDNDKVGGLIMPIV